LVAEPIGDKTIYTITSLASHYSPAAVYVGITVAFMGKMLFAEIPANITAVVSAPILFGTAEVLWRRCELLKEGSYGS
jgi:putative Ca2+/H+ antiporter (TMEM165/GDT1 family)